MTALERMANKEKLQAQRQHYLDGKIDHQTYYLWLADWIGVALHHLPVPIETIKRSKDPHLNDIRLGKWDARDVYVRPLAYAKGLPWSLSDTVCCLKAVARRAAQQEG